MGSRAALGLRDLCGVRVVSGRLTAYIVLQITDERREDARRVFLESIIEIQGRP